MCKRNNGRQKKEEQEVKEEMSFDKCKNERDMTLSDTWAGQKSTLIYVC